MRVDFRGGGEQVGLGPLHGTDLVGPLLRLGTRAVAVLCGIVLMLLVGAPEMASAAAGPAAPALSPVQPGPGGYFHFTLAPGASVSGAVVVTNPGTLQTHYLLYAAATSTAPTSGVAYGQSTTSDAGSAGWVRLPATDITLAAHHHVRIAFTATVPPRMPPGQYVTAIVAQSPDESRRSAVTSGASAVLQLTSREVIAIVVDVPGPARAGLRVGRPSVRDARNARQLLSVPMANTGAVLERPSFTGDVRACGSPGGPVLARAARRLDMFVPHTSIAYPWYFDRPLAAGCYHVELALSVDGMPRVVSRFTGDISVGPEEASLAPSPPMPASSGFPLELAAIDAAALVGLGSPLLLVLRRRRRPQAG